MVYVETSFPRGGNIKPKKVQQIDNMDMNQLFGAQMKKKKVVVKDKQKQKDEVRRQNQKKKPDKKSELIAPFLSSSIRIDGLGLMGCIREITATKLKIQLPCNQIGIVEANAISDAYTRQLTKLIQDGEQPENFKSLEDLFRIGQLVSLKVISAANNPIVCSMNPREINSEIIHSKLKINYLISGAIDEIEDHGYIIDSGIRGLRAFLPKINKNTSYALGEIILCEIEKIVLGTSESTATLKNVDNKKLRSHDFDEADLPTLEMLLPRSVIKMTVTNIVKNSMEGTICEGKFNASVIPYHYSTPSKTASSYFVGQELNAQVVCVMPLTKVVYVSLNMNPIRTPKMSGMIALEKIINDAEVIKQTEKRLELKLGDNLRGLVRNSIRQYNPGQKIKVKTLDYNMFDRSYVCSDDKRLLEDHKFTLNKLKVGDRVDFIVNYLSEWGANGYVGVYMNLRGFIPNVDLASRELAQNDVIPARIVAIEKDKKKVTMTNRSEFLKDDGGIQPLMRREDVEIGKLYTGMVIKDMEKFFIVKFFNQLSGSITKTPENALKLRVGKIVAFKVIFIKEERIVLDLAESKTVSRGILDDDENTTIDIGDVVKGKILSHLPTGLQIQVGEKKCFVSSLSFSCDLHLSQLICNSFKDGAKIKVMHLGRNVYSFRDLDYFTENPIKDFNDLESGDILRGYVKNVKDDGVTIFAPLRNYTKLIYIKKKHFIDDLTAFSTLKPDQLVYVRVEKKPMGDSLFCSGLLENVWSFNFETTIDMFCEYLRDCDRLHTNYKKSGNPIAQYDIGDNVTGTIISMEQSPLYVLVELPNKVMGRLSGEKYDKNLTVGSTLNCTVLWVDIVNKYVDLTRSKQVFTTDFEIDSDVIIQSTVILKKEKFVIAQPKIKSLPVMFVPKSVHFNDFMLCMKSYIFSSVAKLKFFRKYSNYHLAIYDNFYKSFDTTMKMEVDNMNSKKRKRMNEDRDLMNKLKKMKTENGETLKIINETENDDEVDDVENEDDEESDGEDDDEENDEEENEDDDDENDDEEDNDEEDNDENDDEEDNDENDDEEDNDENDDEEDNDENDDEEDNAENVEDDDAETVQDENDSSDNSIEE